MNKIIELLRHITDPSLLNSKRLHGSGICLSLGIVFISVFFTSTLLIKVYVKRVLFCACKFVSLYVFGLVVIPHKYVLI